MIAVDHPREFLESAHGRSVTCCVRSAGSRVSPAPARC